MVRWNGSPGNQDGALDRSEVSKGLAKSEPRKTGERNKGSDDDDEQRAKQREGEKEGGREKRGGHIERAHPCRTIAQGKKKHSATNSTARNNKASAVISETDR